MTDTGVIVTVEETPVSVTIDTGTPTITITDLSGDETVVNAQAVQVVISDAFPQVNVNLGAGSSMDKHAVLDMLTGLLTMNQMSAQLKADFILLRELWIRTGYLTEGILVKADADALTEYINTQITGAAGALNRDITALSAQIANGLISSKGYTDNAFGITMDEVDAFVSSTLINMAKNASDSTEYTDGEITRITSLLNGLDIPTTEELMLLLGNQFDTDSDWYKAFLARFGWLEGYINNTLPGVLDARFLFLNNLMLIEYSRIYNDIDGKLENYSTILITAEMISLAVSSLRTDLGGLIEENSASITLTSNSFKTLVTKINTILSDDGSVDWIKTLSTQIKQTADALVLEAQSREEDIGALNISMGSLTIKAGEILTHLLSTSTGDDWVSRAEFDQEIETRANADEAFIGITTDLHVSYHGPDGLAATIVDVGAAQVDVTLAMGVQATQVQAAVNVINTYETRIGLMEGSVTETWEIVSNAETGVSIEQLNALEAKTFNSNGTLTTAMKLKVNDSFAESSWTTDMDLRVGKNTGNISTAFEGHVDANGVLLKSLTEIVAETVEGTGSAVSEWLSASVMGLISTSDWGVSLTNASGKATTDISHIFTGYTDPATGAVVKGLTELSATLQGASGTALDWSKVSLLVDGVKSSAWGASVVLSDSTPYQTYAANVNATYTALFVDKTFVAKADLEVSSGLNATEVTAKVKQVLQTTNGNNGLYSLTIINGNVISGFGLVSNYLEGVTNPVSTFNISADVFALCAPGSTAAVKPFTVTLNPDGVTAKVEINGSLVVNGSITAPKVDPNALLGDRQIDVAGWGAISIPGGSTGTITHSLGRYPMVCLQDQISGQLAEITGTYFKIKNNDDHSKSIGYIYM